MRSPKEIGEILKEARKKEGVSLENIYKATRIQSRIVEAMEEGRAHEVLDKVYSLSFLKKYASFLKVDAESLAEDYKTFYSGEANRKEEKVFNIKEEPVALKEDIKRGILLAGGITATVILLLILLFFGIKLANQLKLSRAKKTAPVIVKTQEAPKPIKTETKEKKPIFPIPDNRPVRLALRSSADAWLRVSKDGRVVFEGTLAKGESKEWSANSQLELWVGKAEALDFTIDASPIGKIGKGRIRNVLVSRQGLKIGNAWVLKAAK